MTGNEKASLALPAYVPEPDPAVADRLVGVHYFPGWKPGAHWGWGKLLEDGRIAYPERKPILGWYDESNPEVTDWEIKWALEHGISFFVYCWYRNKDNLGKALGADGVRLGHAIHEGLFQCRYKERFRFAIMWENQGAGMESSRDLEENLAPFWCEQYFSKPFYLRIGGRPVLFVYQLDKLIQQAGGVEEARKALDAVRRVASREGVGDLQILCEYRGTSPEIMARIASCGFEAAFAYCWHTKERFPTVQEAFDQQMAKLEAWKRPGSLPLIPTATVGWDPMPWSNEGPANPWLHKDKITRWYSQPAEFRELLRRVKAFSDSFPAGSLTRSAVLLDNWNEWAEGHFISPSAAGGFGYLQAVRDVFTDGRNLPDHRTPEQLGLGPYGPAHPAMCEEEGKP